MTPGSSSENVFRPEDIQASFCEVIVAEWIRQGVTNAVLAPGSRSTPLALALMRANRKVPSFAVDVFHDERSAAFAALGSALVTGRPAVVLCTSGTAAAHLHAAVIEADLSTVPMIVCTADRPPELRDVGAPQTIDQTKLYANAVRWFHDPGVPVLASSASWRSLAARSYWASTGAHPGPVHLNLPFREPLVGRSVPELIATLDDSVPMRKQIRGRGLLSDDEVGVIAHEVSSRRGVIIAGRGCGHPGAVEALARVLEWPVFSEPRSGCGRGDHTIAHADALVRVSNSFAPRPPEVVIRLGEPPASKALSQWVTSSGARQIHVGGSGQMYDSDHRLDLRLDVDIDLFCEALAAQCTGVSADEWFSRWHAADLEVRQLLEEMDRTVGSWTGLRAARAIVRTIPSGSHLVVSSSMPIRDLEWFAGDCSHLAVHSNRGANGIDGVIATAAGVARASQRPTFVMVGDVAAIHDASTLLSLTSRDTASHRLDVRVIVLNNDGGGIFHHLPQAAIVDEATFEALYGTPHGVRFSAVARALGLSTWEIGDDQSDLDVALASPGPSVIEIRTDRESDLAAHRDFHAVVAERMRDGKT